MLVSIPKTFGNINWATVNFLEMDQYKEKKPKDPSTIAEKIQYLPFATIAASN